MSIIIHENDTKNTGISTYFVTIVSGDTEIPPAVTKSIWGIFGIIRLTAGPYLIVITKKEKVGDICGHAVWKVTDTEMYSYKRTTLHLTEKQVFLLKDIFSLAIDY